MKESKDDLASKKRQRNQTNYSEDAYQKQLEAALLAGNGAQSGDDSDIDSDDDGDGQQGKIGWGKKMENGWDLNEAETLADSLMAFGYGNIQWNDIYRRLGIDDKSLDEVS